MIKGAPRRSIIAFAPLRESRVGWRRTLGIERSRNEISTTNFAVSARRHFGLTIDTKCIHTLSSFFFTFVRILRVTLFHSCTRRVEITCAAPFVEFLYPLPSPLPPVFFHLYINMYLFFLFYFIFVSSIERAGKVSFPFPSLALQT